jgi:hypothetical protein
MKNSMGNGIIPVTKGPFIVDEHRLTMHGKIYDLPVSREMIASSFLSRTRTGNGRKDFNRDILSTVLQHQKGSFRKTIQYPDPFVRYVGKYAESLSGVENVGEQLIDFFRSQRAPCLFSSATTGGIAEAAAGAAIEGSGHTLLQRPIRFHLVDFFSLMEDDKQRNRSGYLAVVESKGKLKEGEAEDNLRTHAFDFLMQTSGYRDVTSLPFRGYLVSSLIRNSRNIDVAVLRLRFPFNKGQEDKIPPGFFATPPTPSPTTEGDYMIGVPGSQTDIREIMTPYEYYRAEADTYSHNLARAVELGDPLLTTFFFGGFLETRRPEVLEEIRNEIPKSVGGHRELDPDSLIEYGMHGKSRDDLLRAYGNDVNFRQLGKQLGLGKTGLSLEEHPELVPLVYKSLGRGASFKKRYPVYKSED